jgi:predicted lipid-binding transport protein (Tim44 family)
MDWVGLVNRTDDREDRIVIRMNCRMHDYVETRSGAHIKRNDDDDETTTLCEYWTLEKRDGRWTLLSIEQDSEGAHNLDAAIVASPWGDTERLGQDAVAERAAADAAPPGVSPAELADLDFAGPARAAAMDLSLADGRFDVDLIEASVRRAVSGWAEAVDGDDAALQAAARPEIVKELLHPGDPSEKTRLVVRGPHIDKITIAHLDAQATPARLAIEIQVTGARYIEDRDTAALISGSSSAAATFTERWTLSLDAEGEWPWRISAVGSPVAS